MLVHIQRMINPYFEFSIGDLIDRVNDLCVKKNYSCDISNCLIYERHVGPDFVICLVACAKA